MNNLYGSKFIEKQRSSGYKSTIYAMAEIVDNAVDANASNIDIILVEEEQHRGQRKAIALSEIFFIDNGEGMNKTKMNGCLTFSEGDGKSDKRIGAFGVGLPNSSISVGRRVEVYSKQKNKTWNYVFLDLDDQMNRSEPGYDPAVEKEPDFGRHIRLNNDENTIIHWCKLDKLDAAKAETVIERGSRLLGRIYRYAIQNGLKINIGSVLKGNRTYTLPLEEIIPYDPLFLMEKKNYITDHIWEWATKPDFVEPEIPNNPDFTSIFHYKKFITNCIENETNKSLFQKHDDYHDVRYETVLEGIKYSWTIKASYAYKSISNPGARSGGGTKLGKIIGEKMSGKAHFKSGNIFFIRANREIDFGNFGLYTVTDEKNRFWTIEIHFNSDLDNLMGVSNTKQSVDFWAVTNSDTSYIDVNEKIPEGQKREILYSKMTETIQRCIREMRKSLSGYASEFKLYRESIINSQGNGSGNSVPSAEPAVIQVLPSGQPWTKEQKDEVCSFLKETYMHLNLSDIKSQVELFAKGLTKTLVLYAPNQTGHLYEITEKAGKAITLINTNHIYYNNIIAPLKSNQHLKVFAISIEMLISAYSYEMDKLLLDDPEKHQVTFDLYSQQLSSRLSMFIQDSKILVNPEEWERKTFNQD